LAETANSPAPLSCSAGSTGQAIHACPFGRVVMPLGMTMNSPPSPPGWRPS